MMIEERRTEPLPPNFPDLGRGKRINPASDEAKELGKFEQWPSPWCGKPGNPYKYRPFPKMVYKAKQWMGKWSCHATVADAWEFKDPEERRVKEAYADDFNKACQRTVGNDEELQKAYEEGYRGDPVEATRYAEAREREVGNLAAERAAKDAKMSEPAQREAAAADEETHEHLPEIPEQPVKRKRGRPKGSKNKPKGVLASQKG